MISAIVRSWLAAALLAIPALALEPDFTPLWDREHTAGWKMVGPGLYTSAEGAFSLRQRDPKQDGYYWYTLRPFSDFTLRLEYQLGSKEGNSGVPIRFPAPGNNVAVVRNPTHYHVDISADPDPLQVTGAFMGVKPPSSVPQDVSGWNEMEITATGQHYVVKVNGTVVNDFTGNRAREGFIGLQALRRVSYRNIRIKDLAGAAPAPAAPAVSITPAGTLTARKPTEPGFEVILDRNRTEGWKMFNPGSSSNTPDGIVLMRPPNSERNAYFWYSRRQYSDFILRVDLKLNLAGANSGVEVRMQMPPSANHYEVDISTEPSGYEATGAIMKTQAPTSVPLRPGDWNELEINVTGQRYLVKLNGQLVNDFTGNKAREGFIALQVLTPEVEFRHLRVRDLTAPAPAAPEMPALQLSKAGESAAETLSLQGLNAAAWVLAPLDRAIPADVRQNISFLREDLLDEATRSPKAAPDAYRRAAQLCDTMIAVLDERDRALARAGFRAVEATARVKVSSQALEARRNYKMSWPQFQREEQQRAELKTQALSEAELVKERPKLEWTQRAEQIRPVLDTLYRQFRDALRQPASK